MALPGFEPTVPMERLKGRRVLIVEDEPFVALNLSSYLIECGALIVGPARSMTEAIAYVDRRTFDMAVLDIGLLEGEVYPLAETLSRNDIPFVFYSGRFRVGPSARLLPDVPCIDKSSLTGMQTVASELARLIGHLEQPSFAEA